MNISNIITNILHLLFVTGTIHTLFLEVWTCYSHYDGRPGKSCRDGIKLKPPLCCIPHIFMITDTFHYEAVLLKMLRAQH